LRSHAVTSFLIGLKKKAHTGILFFFLMAAIAPATKKRPRRLTSRHTPKGAPKTASHRHLIDHTLRPPSHVLGKSGLLRIHFYFFVALLQHCALAATGFRRSKRRLLAIAPQPATSFFWCFALKKKCGRLWFLFCSTVEFGLKSDIRNKLDETMKVID